MEVSELRLQDSQQGFVEALPGLRRARLAAGREGLDRSTSSARHYIWKVDSTPVQRRGSLRRGRFMARRVFISYQHDDQMKAKGFNLLRWNKNVDLEFVGQHLLDPVDSTNKDYIKQCVRDELKGTS